MTERLHFHVSLSCIGEGNGNPLHCSCLENPRDGGAWWAAVYRVTQSRTRLKQLSSKGLSRVFSNTTVQKHQFFNTQPSLWFNSHIHTWLWTFVGKVISLLFNTLSRFVIDFLPRSKCLLISWLQHHSRWFWSQEVMGLNAIIFVFLNAEFEARFFNLLFHPYQ